MGEEVQIDELSIAVEKSATDASNILKALASSLRSLNNACKKLSFEKSIESINRLTASVKRIDNNFVNNINGFTFALKDLSKVGVVKTSISKATIAQIESLGNAFDNFTDSKSKRLSELASSLNVLSNINPIRISASLPKQITNIAEALNNVNESQFSKAEKLADSLKPLADLERPHLTSFITQLGKFPDLAKQFDFVDFDKFIIQINRLTFAMRPLANEMQKIANGFSAMPTKIQKFITQSEKMNYWTKRNASTHKTFFNTLINGSDKANNSFKRLATAGIVGLSLKNIVGKIEDSTENLMNYIENLNLFYVSMGEYGEKAYDYAQKISGTMGIDVSEWTRYQAVIMDMSKSFGVTSDTAYTMSKALTQLTYDFSSLYNLKIDEAATKVQSAIAGEIEPIRRLGKDLSVAKLQLTATELGINSNVEAMTQAEKAMLRTITLLRQSSSAQGDLARTLDQPANQMRILKAQLNELARALGEVFLPLLQKGLPYVIATVKVLRLAIHEFAKLAGFKLPEFEFTTTEESVNNVNDALGGTIEKVEKLNQLSFDQLNILGTPNSSTGTGSSDDIAKLTEELNRLAKIEDEAFSKEITSRADEITAAITEWLTQGKGISVWAKDIWDKMLGVKDAVDSIGKSIGIWAIPEEIWNILESMSLDVNKVGINFGSSELGGVTGDGNLRDVLGNALGIALLTGAWLKLLSGGAAGLISYGLGIGLGINGLKMMFDDIGDAEADYSEKNGLYKSFKKALSLSLMGAGLTLATGKGLWHSLNTGFIIAGISLLYDGSNQEEQGEDERLLDAFRTAAGLLLGGVGISGITTKEGKINLTGIGISLGIASASLIYNGAEMITEHDTRAEGFLAQAIGILLMGGTAAIVGAKYGMGIIAGAIGWAVSIPITVALDITLSLEKVKADKNGGFSQRLKSLIMPNDYLNVEGQLDTYLPYEDYGEIASGGTSASKYIANSNRVNDELKSGALSKAESYVDEFMRGVDDGLSKKKLIPAYASGGLPENGLFYANSGELVGRFSNGRTAVANNAIITEGIERAVYRAMMSSRRSNGGKTYLVLDGQVVGKVFGDAIDSERRRSGVEIQVGGGR